MGKERPIIFSGPMVRAILDGMKTQTRRVVKGKWLPLVEEVLRVNGQWVFETMDYDLTTPFGKPGDRLWVRETWAQLLDHYGKAHPTYRADYVRSEADRLDAWRPSIHMPRWASRLTLEITDVRVQRLQDISPTDAIDEGALELPNRPTYAAECEAAKAAGILKPPLGDGPVQRFCRLWDHLHAGKPGLSWEANPFVWAITFKQVTP
jgi:hypothetical protein